MEDNKIISFEDYRRKRAGNDYREDAISSIFRKDLREQKDLIDWYSFHRIFNKYKLFVHCLFSQNHYPQNTNPKAGYIVTFQEVDIEKNTTDLIDAIKWEKRDYILIPAAGLTNRQLGQFLRDYLPNTNQQAYELFKDELLQSDKVIIIQELSRSRVVGRKANSMRSLIKILDDAHFDGIHPAADLIFVDYGDFLHHSWSSIGSYLDVLL